MRMEHPPLNIHPFVLQLPQPNSFFCPACPYRWALFCQYSWALTFLASCSGGGTYSFLANAHASLLLDCAGVCPMCDIQTALLVDKP